MDLRSTRIAERPWGTKQLRRVGERIRSRSAGGAEDPSYDDVMLWYNELATWVQSEIEGMDWRPLLGEAKPSLVSRPKTIDTLRQKLERFPHMDIGSVQDIAGVRFEAEMTLDQQDAVALAIAAHFEHDASCIRDLRAAPHGGYRAVHVWLRFEKRGRVEVQIRTHVQGSWANLFEVAADVMGRGIRYGEMPADPETADAIRSLIALSEDHLHTLEQGRNDLARLDLINDDVARGLRHPLRSPRRRGQPGFLDLDAAWSSLRETEQLVMAGFEQQRAILLDIRAEKEKD